MDKIADSNGENKQDSKRESCHHSILPADSPTSLVEFLSEITESSNELGSTEVDWNETFADMVEELLLSNLRGVYQGAIKQIVELGYTEDVAEKALSRKALYIQEGDPVSNVVNATLNVLKGKNVATSDTVFENFQHLLSYTMLEMITVLRQFRPSLTVGEAMWSLLICDLNVSSACTVEDFLNVDSNEESSTSPSIPQLKSEVQSSTSPSCTSQESCPTHKKCKHEAPTIGKLQSSPNKKSSLASERVKPEEENDSLPTVSGRPFETSEDICKVGSISKDHNIKEIESLRQIYLHMDKIYRASRKGGLTTDKKMEPPSDIHNQQMKSVSSNTTSKQGVCASDATLPDTISSSSIVNPNISASDTISKPKSQPNPFDAQKTPDYYAEIPYDESLGKYLPRDKKDECILKLVPRMHLLQGELQSWINWANKKIMQVTARVGKLRPELKMLKKEKQEAEKDAILFQENAAKISQVDNATENTKKLIESTTSDALILEVENMLLSEELDADRLSLEKSLTRHQQALKREQTALKKAESLESENALHRDDLSRDKQKLSKLQQELDKEKILLTRVEGRVRTEEAEKEKLLAQVASIRREGKQLAEHIKAEEDKIRKKAACKLQKYVDLIVKLESQLEEVKQKSESAKTAALHKGEPSGSKKPCTSKTVVSCQAKSAARSFRREQECVMCLSEEASVVFLPCAHEVLCPACNKLHEKQRMKDCPSCRTPIQHRIHVRFAADQWRV
ncbi:hypothetical protein TanjilG_01844 [Lupinus angustifolius]|uniref:putative E3 ubiquitin-protein ligase RF298 n=1 Tax=Lupinus angustifolius TaxID=3871 RepID=UPI00090E9ED8|nr:PREDICTED: putative E3 ubiquitin-protein ligase RF298 [Lupinus angustifolius]OIV91313.1 hypothetical protein TanjilG_01844 [Lupinus angustifolius]